MKQTYQQFNRMVYDYYNQYYATERTTLMRRLRRNLINNNISIKQNNTNYFIKNGAGKKYYFYNPPDYQYAFIEYQPNKNNKNKKIQQFIMINSCWVSQGCFFIGAKENLSVYLLGCPNKGIEYGAMNNDSFLRWYPRTTSSFTDFRFKENRISSSGPCNQN